MEKDILREIPDEHLPLLRNLYRDYEEEAPYIVTLLQTCIQWKKKKSTTDYLTILGLNNDWLETGTIVIIMHFPMKNIFYHTLQEKSKTLFEAFKKTSRINWDVKNLFFAILEKNDYVLRDLVDHFNMEQEHYSDTLWTISKDDALELEIECPDNVYIAKLNKTHATIVNDIYPFKRKDSDLYMAALIENNSSYGVFLKSNDKLVSWVLLNNFGQLTCLQTVPEYYGNGYAFLLSKLMTKEVAQQGYTPSITILEGNQASINLFRKIGYKRIGRCTFKYCIRNKC